MVVVREWGENYINKSLKQATWNTWVIGDLVLSRSKRHLKTATWTDEVDGSSYTITTGPNYLPSASVDSPHIKLIHEAGDAPAVWSIGKSAMCKVRYFEEGITAEAVTLDFVPKKTQLSDACTALAQWDKMVQKRESLWCKWKVVVRKIASS